MYGSGCVSLLMRIMPVEYEPTRMPSCRSASRYRRTRVRPARGAWLDDLDFLELQILDRVAADRHELRGLPDLRRREQHAFGAALQHVQRDLRILQVGDDRDQLARRLIGSGQQDLERDLARVLQEFDEQPRRRGRQLAGARERRLARHLDEHAEFDTIRHREIDGQAILHEDDLHLLEQRGIGRLPIDDRDLARARRQPPGLRRILHDECGHADMQRFLGDLVREPPMLRRSIQESFFKANLLRRDNAG